ncbi:peptide-methionine (S)-S-oxide reductase MsrA [Nitrosomonas sp. Is37]|uniref:peptide-methionine (S)-S-oxide reductase MsrA n=1 Tax=Nitrosomonas sp. Is37 TaxID=3080535 RepID=UPI00294B0FA4|nr:peptide-methionine (S)-S-oxide reductase MsrA [Nitrosomonas sp. Is37]MDV6345821.1 peptide-methionine (S)-S-oxide reductase MsrA [Nitrosomonas sp. Is37]
MKAIIAATLSLLIVMTAFAMEKTVISSRLESNQNISSKTDYIVLGMGCFWGAEKRMSEIPGVLDVESGYAGGDLPGVGYQQILNHEKALRAGKAAGRNHAEVIKVTFDPEKVTLETVLAKFWENHNPTQGDRQGNDIGSNYRSAIYYHDAAQKDLALATQKVYQQALNAVGYGPITTEILPLKNYITAEEYHQDYLKKNPNGYCGLGGTGVKYPASNHKATQNDPLSSGAITDRMKPLNGKDLNFAQQLVIFEAENCEFCKQFDEDILNRWQAEVPVVATMNANPPAGWTLEKPLFAAPTIVLFRNGKEVTRYTGYNGEQSNFWKWLGFQLLSPGQQKIAFEQGTEPPFTATNLDEKRPGKFVDPITGATLFLSQTKFDSKSGWPSFFDPVEGSVTLHEDNSHGMKRTEVRSASSGIHLGHVFNDGPAPNFKRYCINGNVLKFIPD